MLTLGQKSVDQQARASEQQCKGEWPSPTPFLLRKQTPYVGWEFHGAGYQETKILVAAQLVRVQGQSIIHGTSGCPARGILYLITRLALSKLWCI